MGALSNKVYSASGYDYVLVNSTTYNFFNFSMDNIIGENGTYSVRFVSDPQQRTLRCVIQRDGEQIADRDLSFYLSRIVGYLEQNAEEEGAAVSVRAAGGIAAFETEWYELVPVYVEGNLPELNEESRDEWIPSRAAPFWLYDCAKPLGARVSPKAGGVGLYAALRIPAGAEPGVYEGVYEISLGGERFAVPVSLQIYAAQIPEEEHLKIINGYSSGHAAKCHGAEGDAAACRALDEQYLRMLRRMRQNMLYVGGVVRTGPDEAGHYHFDFTPLKESVEVYLSLGYKYFNMASVGGRKSWKESTILVAGFPAMSYEAYRYLADYLPALQRFLDEQGWTERFYMGVSDEPNDANATEFRALCGLVRKLAPRIRLLDALSYTAVHGALDVWVPLNAEYDKHTAEFESFRVGSDEIWHYVCCGPRGGQGLHACAAGRVRMRRAESAA